MAINNINYLKQIKFVVRSMSTKVLIARWFIIVSGNPRYREVTFKVIMTIGL